jgi:hypothetical protein
MQIEASHLILDACCMLNFAASGHLLEILQVLPLQAVIPEIVKENELLTLQRLSKQEKSAIEQFESAIDQGILQVEDFNSEEENEAFVNYAAALGDDGESAVGAIAVCRGWAIATDDKKAIKFFQAESPTLQICSTLEIIKYWSGEVSLTKPQLFEVLDSIRIKGKYVPHRQHSLLAWWETILYQS